MEYLLGFWLLCGIGAGVVAGSKGRSGCGWLILGFLLGPIGLLISAGMSNLTQAAQLDAIAADRQREQTSTRACPQCAEQIQRAAIKCRFCNATVKPLMSAAEIQEVMRQNAAAYGIGSKLGKNFSAWWLVAIGVVVILAAKSCIG